MDNTLCEALWQQFGGAIDMLDAAIVACPADRWGDRRRQPEFWAVAFHTLFWLDHYLADDPERFQPPSPFGLEELDPSGVLPPRVYLVAELRSYLRHCRDRCRRVIAGMTPERAAARRRIGRVEGSQLEGLLYNLRHVQHHTGQLNLLLRQHVDDAPRWIARAGDPLQG